LRPFVTADTGKRIVPAHNRALMECAGQLIGSGPVVGERRLLRLGPDRAPQLRQH